MNSKHFTHPLLAIVLLFASCTPATQKESGDNSATTSGGVWKKQVTRIIDMGEKEDTAVHHLREANQDTTLLELFINAIKAGQITAYSNSDNQFTTKLTVAALNEMTGGRTDTMMVTDPVTGQELTKVVRREFNYDMVHKYRLMENWTFNPGSGKTEIQIVGIAPIKEIYGDDGVFRGVQAMFWLHYDDVRPILTKAEQFHPNHNLNSLLWNDYFFSEVKPAAAK